MACPRKEPLGFTLVELLITITVLVFLLLFSSLTVSSQLKKVRDGKRKAHLNRIKIALYDYFFDKDCFPESLPDCQQPLKSGETVYLEQFPCDPSGNSYVYQTDDKTCRQWFKVLTNLENLQDTDIDRIGCRSGCGPECQYNFGTASTNIQLNQGCPQEEVALFACTPNGQCAEFENPELSRCPRVFENDPSCQNACQEKENRCHDNRGKKTPDQ